MEKSGSTLLISVLLLSFLVFSPVRIAKSAPTTWIIPDDYPTIQEAIVFADDTDSILVYAGTYTENLDFLGKSIKLIGWGENNSTILQPADPNISTITMTDCDDLGTELIGFTITGGGNVNTMV